MERIPIVYIVPVLSMLIVPTVLAQTTVTGEIVDFGTGLGIGDAIVSLVHVNDPERTHIGANAPVSIPADSAGTFEFDENLMAKVASEEVILIARAHGYGFSARRLNRSALAGHYRLSLRPLAPVFGVVKTGEGVPIAGATVGIVYEDPVLRGIGASSGWQYRGVYTGGEGAFATHVSVGYSFVVEAFHEDYLPVASALTEAVPDGPPVPTFELRLADGIEVSGRIVDAAGSGRSGVKVRLFSNEPLPYAQSRAFAKKLHQVTESTVDGTFSFRGVSSGRKELLVTDSRGTPLTRRTLNLSSSAIDLQIELP